MNKPSEPDDQEKKSQITNIMKEKRDTTTDPTDCKIKRE